MAKTYEPKVGDLVFFSTPARGGKMTQRIGQTTGDVLDGFYCVGERIGDGPEKDALVRPSAITGKATKAAQRVYQGGVFLPAVSSASQSSELRAA